MTGALPCCDFAPPAGVHRGSSEFSRLHRLHHSLHVDDTRPMSAPLEVDLLQLYVVLDQLVAHAYEPEILPDLTPGAQALLGRARR